MRRFRPRAPRLTGYRDAVVIRRGPKESRQQVPDEVGREGGDTDHEAIESRLRGPHRCNAETREEPGESAPEGTGEHGHPGEAAAELVAVVAQQRYKPGGPFWPQETARALW